MPKYIGSNLGGTTIIGETEEEFRTFYDRCWTGEIHMPSSGFSKVYNLTPHTVTVHLPNGDILTFPSDGQARAATETADAGVAFGLPLVHLHRASVEWPEGFRPEPGSTVIVSTITADALRREHGGRGWENGVTFLVPDSGPGSVIRDENGAIAGVKRFEIVFRATSEVHPWYRPVWENLTLTCQEHCWAGEASSVESKLIDSYKRGEIPQDLSARAMAVIREGNWRLSLGPVVDRSKWIFKNLPNSSSLALFGVDIGMEYFTYVIARPTWEPTWDRASVTSKEVNRNE